MCKTTADDNKTSPNKNGPVFLIIELKGNYFTPTILKYTQGLMVLWLGNDQTSLHSLAIVSFELLCYSAQNTQASLTVELEPQPVTIHLFLCQVGP